MRPDELKTKIFLDGGDPVETAEIKSLPGIPRRSNHEPDARGEESPGPETAGTGHEVHGNRAARFLPAGGQYHSGHDPAGFDIGRGLCRCRHHGRRDAASGQGDVLLDPERPDQVPDVPRGAAGGRAGGRGGAAREPDALLFPDRRPLQSMRLRAMPAKGQVYVSPFVGQARRPGRERDGCGGQYHRPV